MGISSKLWSPLASSKVGQGDLEVGTAWSRAGDWHLPGPRYSTLPCEGMGKVGSRSKSPSLPSRPSAAHRGASHSVWPPPCWRPWVVSRSLSCPSFIAGRSSSPLVLPPHPMFFLCSPFSALSGSSGVPVPPTQWTGRGRGTLEVGFPSSTSGSLSSDRPLLSALGVGALSGRAGLPK